jgi:hypothetical protein
MTAVHVVRRILGMPVFQKRTSDVLLKQAETLHNLARRAKQLANASSIGTDQRQLLSHARELQDRAVRLEQEAADQ